MFFFKFIALFIAAVRGLGYNIVGGAAAFQVGRIYMISLCVGMSGHLNLGLCVWSKRDFCGVLFKQVSLVFWL